MLNGDSGALTRLMERYDRLVRYTVFRASRRRCLSDPQWVDTIASDAWTGFVRSMQRKPDDLPASVRTYLSQVARNRCLDALRSAPPQHDSIDHGEMGNAVEADAGVEDPSEASVRLEQIDALRACVGSLSDDDQAIYAHLDLITQRRWKEAAKALGMPEATLRSRWTKILERLSQGLAGETGL